MSSRPESATLLDDLDIGNLIAFLKLRAISIPEFARGFIERNAFYNAVTSLYRELSPINPFEKANDEQNISEILRNIPIIDPSLIQSVINSAGSEKPLIENEYASAIKILNILRELCDLTGENTTYEVENSHEYLNLACFSGYTLLEQLSEGRSNIAHEISIHKEIFTEFNQEIVNTLSSIQMEFVEASVAEESLTESLAELSILKMNLEKYKREGKNLEISLKSKVSKHNQTIEQVINMSKETKALREKYLQQDHDHFNTQPIKDALEASLKITTAIYEYNNRIECFDDEESPVSLEKSRLLITNDLKQEYVQLEPIQLEQQRIRNYMNELRAAYNSLPLPDALEQDISRANDELSKCTEDLLILDSDLEKQKLKLIQLKKEYSAVENDIFVLQKNRPIDFSTVSDTNQALKADLTKVKNQARNLQKQLYVAQRKIERDVISEEENCRLLILGMRRDIGGFNTPVSSNDPEAYFYYISQVDMNDSLSENFEDLA